MININIEDVFKSFGSFLVKNWQGVGLVVVLVLFFVTKNDYASLKKSMDVMGQSYEAQISALEELHKKEIAEREAAILEYEKELIEISDKYKDALIDLQQAREKDIENFIRDFEKQPEVIAIEIEEIFGFEYVE